MNINELPQGYIQSLRKRFEEDEKIRQLRIKANQLQCQGRFIQALKLNEDIEQIFRTFVDACMKEAEKETKLLTAKQAGIPDEDTKEIEAHIVVLFMMLDIIDSVVVDINDIVRRTDETYSFEMVDTIRELATETRLVLRKFEHQEKYMKTKKWGDVVDNVYQMIKNKAKKLIK